MAILLDLYLLVHKIYNYTGNDNLSSWVNHLNISYAHDLANKRHTV